jgi:hypothetical protein
MSNTEQNSQPSSDQRVRREFVLITSGQDPEIDAIGICQQALVDLTMHQCDRIARYLLKRYGFGDLQ